MANVYNGADGIAYPNRTLAALRRELMVRLGYAAMTVSPPGMDELLNSFLIEAQELLYWTYEVFRLQRWFTWTLVPGIRFYDYSKSNDVVAGTSTLILDPRKIKYVGLSNGDVAWRPMHKGINPGRYTAITGSIPDSYELGSMLEIWPPPSSAAWQLRVKGDFKMLPFAIDTDITSMDYRPVFLYALANAKAHYTQPDAGNYMGRVKEMIGALTAGTHATARYVPGAEFEMNAIMPVMI